MAIEFFVQEEEAVNLDFAGEYLEENPKEHGKTFDVFSIKKAKSGKGYMIYTSHFICWFFKKEKVLTQVLEALDYYCKTGTGFQFVVQLDKKAAKKFHLGIDTDRGAKYVPLENGYILSGHKNDTEDTPQKEVKSNPFLIKQDSTPSLTSHLNLTTPSPDQPLETTPTLNGRAKGREGAKK